MSQVNKITLKFLQELNSSKEMIDTLNFLIKILENKTDPEPEEIQIVDSAYQFIEKLKSLESNIRIFQENSYESLPGNKLSKLYKTRSRATGTQSLFE